MEEQWKTSHAKNNTTFSDAGNLYGNNSRLSVRLDSFSISGAKLWSCLKSDRRKLRKKKFTNKIHHLLLAVLDDKGAYVKV